MDKQQAAREAFEEWADDKGWPPRGTAWRREGYAIWKASREALMPSLVEARDVLAFYAEPRNTSVDFGKLLAEAKAWDGNTLCGIQPKGLKARQTLARINLVIGDKK